jgi:hypothetical protein
MTTEKTYVHDEHEYPATILANGKTMHLHLLDTQTGDCVEFQKVAQRFHPNSLKWLTPIYMER